MELKDAVYVGKGHPCLSFGMTGLVKKATIQGYGYRFYPHGEFLVDMEGCIFLTEKEVYFGFDHSQIRGKGKTNP